MPIDTRRTRQHLAEFDFPTLFTEELGWDRGPRQPLPDRATRVKIHREVSKLHFEHMLIFTDADRIYH